MFGFGDVLELDLLIQAQDMATGVLQGIGGVLQSIVTQTASFDTAIMSVRTNTTLTAADVDKMRQTILAINAQSGAPLTGLETGFRNIDDIVGNVNATMAIARVASESATGSYTDQATTMTLLGQVMHEYGADVSTANTALQQNIDITQNATKYMGVMHLAALDSGVGLQQFFDAASQPIAWAANLQVGIEDISAAMATMTKHGYDAATSATQLRGLFTHMVKPAQAQQDALANLSEASGVDLTADFTPEGLAAKHLSGVMDDLSEAYKKLGLTQAQATAETMNLIPAQRGSAAAFVLTGTGLSDYGKIIDDVTNKQKVMSVTQDNYNLVLGTFDQKVAIIGANWNQFLMDIGQPVVDALTPYLNNLIDFLNTHKADITAFGTALGKDIGGAVTDLIKDIPVLVANIGTAVSNLGTFADSVGTFFDQAGTGIHDTMVNILAGLFDMSSALTVGIENAMNGVIGALDALLTKFNQPTIDPIKVPSSQQILGYKEDYLAGIFGAPYGFNPTTGIPIGTNDINPATGKRYTGGGGNNDALGTTTDYGLAVASGGTLRYVGPNMGTGGGGGSGSGGNGGGGSGGYGTGGSVPDYLALAQRAYKDATDRFDIDLSKNRTNLDGPGVQSLLKGDINAIVKDMVPLLGYDSLDVQKAHRELLSQIDGATAARAAAQRAYKDATDRFDIDLSKNKANLDGPGVQPLLKTDINAILKDMVPLLGYDSLDVQKAHRELLSQIAANTAGTAQALSIPRAALSGGRLLNAEAGYNSDQFAFGSTKDSASAIIAALQQQLAGKTEEITLLRQLVTLLGGANELAKRGLAPTAYNPVRSRAVGGAF